MSIEAAILDALRSAGTNGMERWELTRLVAQRYDIAAVAGDIAALLRRRPHVISQRYHGPKKGHLLYLVELKPLSRAELIRRYLDERFRAPKGQCAACKGPLTGRQTRWCSEECANTYLGLVNASLGRRIAYTKSQVCALCEAPLFVKVAPGDLGYEGEFEYELVSARGDVVKRTEKKPRGFEAKPTSKNWWAEWVQVRTPEMREAELDHVVPLVEGGDHDWHNLRLLCKPCHASETASLAARRATKRRHEKRRPSLPEVAE